MSRKKLQKKNNNNTIKKSVSSIHLSGGAVVGMTKKTWKRHS